MLSRYDVVETSAAQPAWCLPAQLISCQLSVAAIKRRSTRRCRQETAENRDRGRIVLCRQVSEWGFV
jgi:hypothetical protein